MYPVPALLPATAHKTNGNVSWIILNTFSSFSLYFQPPCCFFYQCTVKMWKTVLPTARLEHMPSVGNLPNHTGEILCSSDSNGVYSTSLICHRQTHTMLCIMPFKLPV